MWEAVVVVGIVAIAEFYLGTKWEQSRGKHRK